jgi:hypothetical protein
MTLGELKSIVDALYEVHGPDLYANFRYQFASGKVKAGPVTSYRVCPPKNGLHGSVTFSVNHARGDEE